MSDATIGKVYLLHLSSPLKHARHYIGWAKKLERRLLHHQNGTGARMLAACVTAGITFERVRVWEGKTRNFERQLKNHHKSQNLCPICNPTAPNRMKG